MHDMASDESQAIFEELIKNGTISGEWLREKRTK